MKGNFFLLVDIVECWIGIPRSNGYHSSIIDKIPPNISLSVLSLALGSRPRQGLAKVWAKKEARESHFMLLGV
jgi:hypothetical protein